MAKLETIEIPLPRLDCADDAHEVERTVAALPGVEMVTVLLSAQKAIIRLDPARADRSAISKALECASCCAPHAPTDGRVTPLGGFTRHILTLFGIVFGAVLFIVVVGEWLEVFEALTKRVP